MLNLDKKKKYLLACSYGPDSMALFFLLLRDGYDFDVAHVNYHLRKESDDETRGLSAFCKEHNKNIFVLNVNENISRNIEAKCREIRYKFFANLYHQNNYDACLVAHNEDDHIETYLLQKKRKNLPLFYGINESTHINDVLILRPLLHFSKKELTDICETNNVPYSIDSTNLELSFERNKIRHNIVSKFSEGDRADILEQIRIENELLNNMLSNLEQVDNHIPNILALNDIEFCYYLNVILQRIGCFKAITYKQSFEVRKLLQSKKANILLNISPKFCLEKNYDVLLFKDVPTFTGYSFLMSEPSLIDNEFFFADFTKDASNRNVHDGDYPLTIRTVKTGDLYKIKNYQVKVNRLFIDWKMPMSLRKRWPVIINKEGVIIYIPRYQKDFVPNKDCNFYVKECFTFQ